MDEKVNVLIELNFKKNEKIKLSPVGSFTGVDGRKFMVDEETIKATKENKVDLVINENHGFSSSGDKATGWVDIESLEIKNDGLYGSINWTKLGEELVKDKLYRYLSPEYVMDKNSTVRKVLYICGMGLVNSPNLLDKALNKQEEEQLDIDKLKDAEAEIKKLQDELERIKKESNGKSEENEKLRELNHELSIDLALERNQILPAQVEFCKSLSEVQFSKFIESNSVNVDELKKETPAGGEIKRELNSLESKICEQLGIGELQ